MADPISFDPFLGWVDITDPNNIPEDARVISATDLLRYENFGSAAAARLNELSATGTDAGLAELVATPTSAIAGALSASIIGQSEQVDFVALAQRRSPYVRMTVKRVAYSGFDNAIEVSCHADDAAGRRLAYLITGGTAYRIVGDVNEYGPEYATSYAPSPTADVSTDYGAADIHIYKNEITTAGAGWNTSSTLFTTTAGATFTAQITTTAANSRVYFTSYRDNRGGIWNFDLVEAPAVTGSISTYAAAAGIAYGNQVLTVPTAGTYTLRGTFAGADPLNAPSGGVARGWLLNATTNTFYLARVSTPIMGSATLSAGVSNKNWAFKVQNPSVGGEEFIPYHGTAVETIVDAALFFDGTDPIDISAMAVNQSRDVDSFTMVQHIKGHTSASPTELVEVWTTDTITADGTYHAEGAIKTLSALLATDAMYTGMLPVNPARLDTVVTAYRNAYPATVAMANGSSTNIPAAEGLYSRSVAVVGPDSGHVAAVRFNDLKSTRRVQENANLTDAVYRPMFIEHRNATLTKVYPRFGYLDGTTVPAGTVWRFDLDFWFGRVPGIKPMIAV